MELQPLLPQQVDFPKGRVTAPLVGVGWLSILRLIALSHLACQQRPSLTNAFQNNGRSGI